MSRSKRKTPMCGWTTAESEKKDKQKSHRRFRRKVAEALRKEYESTSFPEKDRDITNPYSMDKDGKQRFDPEKYPEGMRK